MRIASAAARTPSAASAFRRSSATAAAPTSASARLKKKPDSKDCSRASRYCPAAPSRSPRPSSARPRFALSTEASAAAGVKSSDSRHNTAASSYRPTPDSAIAEISSDVRAKLPILKGTRDPKGLLEQRDALRESASLMLIDARVDSAYASSLGVTRLSTAQSSVRHWVVPPAACRGATCLAEIEFDSQVQLGSIIRDPSECLLEDRLGLPRCVT